MNSKLKLTYIRFSRFLVELWRLLLCRSFLWLLLHPHCCVVTSGSPRLARPPSPGPCLDFGFQYAFIRNNRSKKFGVEYWALPGSNSPWRPCFNIDSFLRNTGNLSYSDLGKDCLKTTWKSQTVNINPPSSIWLQTKKSFHLFLFLNF